jgi:hypothetical protein
MDRVGEKGERMGRRTHRISEWLSTGGKSLNFTLYTVDVVVGKGKKWRDKHTKHTVRSVRGWDLIAAPVPIPQPTTTTMPAVGRNLVDHVRRHFKKRIGPDASFPRCPGLVRT